MQADTAAARAFPRAHIPLERLAVSGNVRGDSRLDFARAVSEGLQSQPQQIPSRFLYDARGSLLFELITRQPEYYLTRTESTILGACSGRIREITGHATIVELGSGNSEKTGYLLGAWLARDRRAWYVPVDVSASALRRAREVIEAQHAGVEVVPLHCDYYSAFPLIRQASPALVTFLGSSIGNFAGQDMDHFLTELARSLSPGDHFLAGFDLVKNQEVIEAAYNDAAGVTANFTRNLFVRMNRELESGIDTSAVRHEAHYSASREQVEIDARFISDQSLQIAPLGKSFAIRRGDAIRTEISRKFRLESLIPYLESFGLRTRDVFTDANDWFALVLLQKEAAVQPA